MKDKYRVYASIDLDAIYKNIINAKKKIKKTKLLAVIKANGYGHGAVPIAHHIEDIVDGYGVATIEEGIELRRANIKKDILILSYIPPSCYEKIVAFNLDVTIYTLESAELISKLAKQSGKIVNIHIAIDTGMHRIGFLTNRKSIENIKKIQSLDNIFLKGCFSHFSKMDEQDKTTSKIQLETFTNFINLLKKQNINFQILHIANSAAIFDMPESYLDMVRYGISLYGIYPSDYVKKENINLYPAMSLKTYVSHIKYVEKNSEIGYGGSFTTSRLTKVATVPVGYADGYPRSLSNTGRVLIHGCSVPIIGKICMDQFMVDVTEIESVSIGDEVTLIGKDGEYYISVDEIARIANTIPHEILCNIGKRVLRIYNKDYM